MTHYDAITRRADSEDARRYKPGDSAPSCSLAIRYKMPTAAVLAVALLALADITHVGAVSSSNGREAIDAGTSRTDQNMHLNSNAHRSRAITAQTGNDGGRVLQQEVATVGAGDDDANTNTDAAVEFVIQHLGRDGEVPAPSAFEQIGPGSFSADGGWFYRTYNEAGHFKWTLGGDGGRDEDHEKDGAASESIGSGISRDYLRIDYGAEQSESWGGFVDFGHILVDRNSMRNESMYELGYASHLYNCADATHVRLGYRIVTPQSLVGRAHLRLILLDGSNCDDGGGVSAEDSSNGGDGGDGSNGSDGGDKCAAMPGQSLENWYSFNYVLDEGTSSSDSWQELVLPWSAFERPGWTGQVGNDMLDLDAIRGWRMEISIDSQGDLGSSSSGVIDVGRLSCVGPPGDEGALISSPFRSPASSANLTVAISNGIWSDRYYQSPLSRNLTFARLFPASDTLVVNYTVEQSESWGGFIDYSHITPGFYDLASADAISLDYEVLEPASAPTRAHLRLILLDGSDCTGNDGRCDAYPGQALENYYSFHYILDGAARKRGTIKIPLVGTSDAGSPFYRTGWTGSVGNDRLDANAIRGFRLEINVDSAGTVGSLVSGVVAVGNLSAVLPSTSGTIIQPLDQLPEAKCIFEPDLLLSTASSVFKRIEFVGSRCCELCLQDANCLFAHDTGRDCFLSSGLETDAAPDSDLVQLSNTEFLRSTTSSYWMDDPIKRGDFCTVCSCDESRGMIDCSGRDLAIVPKTFSQSWAPTILDLTNNSRLLIIGENSFEALAETLQLLRLPKSAQFISPKALEDISAIVEWESDQEEATGHLDDFRPLNVITNTSSSFGDVCCGVHDNNTALGDLLFCELKVFIPGVDSTYEPFIQYHGASQIREIKASSSFMSEAAASAELCAEYCAISSDCRYFSYDARWKESEHRCYLLKTNGTKSEEICCDPDDYSDEDGTMPGWTSGRPPRTRHNEDNARVILAPRNGLKASDENNFEVGYSVKLGSDPLRGAVWVEPRVLNADDFDVVISPSRVVLYDSTTVAQVSVSVDPSAAVGTSTIVVDNLITTCDAAFTSATLADLAEMGAIYIDVAAKNEQKTAKVLFPMIFVPLFLFFVMSAAGYILFKRKRREADSVWRVHPSELKFPPEPEILGRGTFGLVILAEYRGSPVAVKRVIPSKQGSANGSRNSSALRATIQRQMSTGHVVGAEELYSAFNESHSSSIFTSPEEINGLDDDIEVGMSSESTRSNRSSQRSQMTRANSSRAGLLSGFYETPTHEASVVCSETTRSRLRRDFIQEMRTLSKLRHPCITTVMGAVIENGVEPALVMEYMDRGSLYDLLHNSTVVMEGELLLPILCDIAQGVRFLHAASPQVIHGDLKCANILVDGRFRAKVADFGLTQKKQVGKGTGTPYWMAPELLRGHGNTAASDVYSFGIILFEVYSRQDPYEGEDYHDVVKLVADPKVNKRPEVPVTIPHPMKELMDECLHALPTKRPTFGDIDQRLRDLDSEMVEPEETHLSLQTRKDRRVLHEVFPPKIAQTLREGRKVEPEYRDIVTIFFSDIIGFTEISSELSPLKISDLLDRLYTKFDELSRRHGVFKVETIGDAYMAVTNLVKDQPDHVLRIANFAVDAIVAASETLIDVDNPSMGFIKIRVGFHSGSVVANVVGRVNPRYCLFGDTVNTASRMESNSKAGRIHCSEKSAILLRRQHPEMPIVCRGLVTIKGKGAMRTYWVNQKSRMSKRSSLTTVNSIASINSIASSSNTSRATFANHPSRSREPLSKRAKRLSLKADANLVKLSDRPISANV